MKDKTIKIVEKKNPSVFEEAGVEPVVEKLEKQSKSYIAQIKYPGWLVIVEEKTQQQRFN